MSCEYSSIHRIVPCSYPRHYFHSFHSIGKDIQLMYYVTFVIFLSFSKLFYQYFFRKKETYTSWAYLCLFYLISHSSMYENGPFLFLKKSSQMAIDYSCDNSIDGFSITGTFRMRSFCFLISFVSLYLFNKLCGFVLTSKCGMESIDLVLGVIKLFESPVRLILVSLYVCVCVLMRIWMRM